MQESQFLVTPPTLEELERTLTRTFTQFQVQMAITRGLHKVFFWEGTGSYTHIKEAIMEELLSGNVRPPYPPDWK